MNILIRNGALNGLKLTVLFLLLLMSTAGQAQQQRTDAATQTATVKAVKLAVKDTAVRTFQVRPSQTRVLVAAAGEHPPQRPKPLDRGAKERALESVGGGGGGGMPTPGNFETTPEVKLEHIVLSAKRPFYNKRGYLKTTLAFTADPNSNINFNTNFPGMATIYLNVEQGHTYLLDFSVSSWATGTYKIKTESGSQSFDDPGGHAEHILIGLNAQSSGWTPIEFDRQGPGYYLYSIEVTRAN